MIKKLYLGLTVAGVVLTAALIAPKSPVSAKETIAKPLISQIEARKEMLDGI